MKYTSSNYEVETVFLLADSYFLGQYVSNDTSYYIARDNIKNTIVSSFKDDLTEEIKSEILRTTKNLKTELIQQEDDKNLKYCFEYPTDSGQSFPISRKQFAYYNSIFLFKDSFSFPFEFLGNDGAKTTFENTSDIDLFISSALSKHQEVYKNRYIVAINAINAVEITTTIDDAISEIMQINY